VEKELNDKNKVFSDSIIAGGKKREGGEEKAREKPRRGSRQITPHERTREERIRTREKLPFFSSWRNQKKDKGVVVCS